MRALVVVVALAACGGGGQGAAPAKDPEPVVAKEPPPTHEQHVAALEDLATRGCACADAACIRAVDADLAELIREVPVGDAGVAVAFSMPAIEALGRYLTCVSELGAEPELSFYEALPGRLEEVGDLACACRDVACVDRIFGGLINEIFAAWKHLPDDEKFMSRADIPSKRIEECTGPINAKAAEQAVVELTELRAAACACTTSECADAVQADFDAFLEKHAETKGNQEQAETIGKIAGEMSACLATAKGEPPP